VAELGTRASDVLLAAIADRMLRVSPVVDFITYKPPVANVIELATEPRLESWEKKSHPSQEALAQYLTQVVPLAAPAVRQLSGGASLELVVGSAPSVPLTTGGRDLDNFLFPLVRALGANHFLSVWGRKQHGPSLLRVGPAEARGDEDFSGWSFVQALTRSSYTATTWKTEIHDQVEAQVAEATAGGPLEVQLAFRVSNGRNWSNLWKPAIDSLGRILGEGARQFDPNDDRIIRLGLHRILDPAMRWTVGVGVWWRLTQAGS
jgi:hypothetical protein